MFKSVPDEEERLLQTQIFDFVKTLQVLNLSEIELALFSATLLVRPGEIELELFSATLLVRPGENLRCLVLLYWLDQVR